MKFGQHFLTHLIPEWEDEYIDYIGGKERLEKAVANVEFLEANNVTLGKATFKLNLEKRELEISPAGTSAEAVLRFVDNEVTQCNRFFISQFLQFVTGFIKFSDHLEILSPAQRVNLLNVRQKLERLAECSPNMARVAPRNFAEDGSPLIATDLWNAEHLLSLMRRDSGATTDRQQQPHMLKIRGMRSSWTMQEVKKRSRREQRQVARVFIEHFRAFVYLAKFQEVNTLSLEKLLKKIDKNLHQIFSSVYLPLAEAEFIFSTKLLSQVQKTIETIWIEKFVPDLPDPKAAKSLIHQTKEADHRENTDPNQFFWLGLWMGVSFLLLLVPFVFNNDVVENMMDLSFGPAHAILRGFGVALLMGWCWGLNTIGWHMSRINYGYIFQLPFKVNYVHIFQISGMLTSVWLLTLFIMADRSIFTITDFTGYNAEKVFGAVWLVLFSFAFLNPFRMHNKPVRVWFLGAVKRNILAGLKPVRFVDFWLADQLVSLAIVYSDVFFLICYYTSDVYTGDQKCTSQLKYTRPLFVLMPYTMRFAQCIRKHFDGRKNGNTSNKQLMNALKYFTSILITIFSALYRLESKRFLPAWMFFAVVGLFYNYYWDVHNDWGFFTTPRTSHLWPLRKGLKLAGTKFYYRAIVINFVLRLTWVLSISERAPWVRYPYLWSVITSILEVLRRFQWNFIRLEYEHTFNTENYRAVEKVELPKFMHSEAPQQPTDTFLRESTEMTGRMRPRDASPGRSVRFQETKANSDSDVGNDVEKDMEMAPLKNRTTDLEETLIRASSTSAGVQPGGGQPEGSATSEQSRSLNNNSLDVGEDVSRHGDTSSPRSGSQDHHSSSDRGDVSIS